MIILLIYIILVLIIALLFRGASKKEIDLFKKEDNKIAEKEVACECELKLSKRATFKLFRQDYPIDKARYKYLKRCRNRERLYEKLKKLGRRL